MISMSRVASPRIRSKSDVGFLVSSWPDQCVHFGNIDVVQLLDGCLDLVLVGLDVTDEDQGVVVLNLLHGGLSGQRVLDDGVGIHLVPLGSGLAGVLGVPGSPEGLGPVELDASSNLLHPGAMGSLHHLLLDLLGSWLLLLGLVSLLGFRLSLWSHFSCRSESS